MNKNLKSLDEHNAERWKWHSHSSISFNKPVLNGIACPKCEEELFDTNPWMTLTSNPPKKNVHCSKCDYHGYRIV
jgi:hypothetical protein